MKKIVIWGSGNICEEVYKNKRDIFKYVTCIVDSYKYGNKIGDFEIKSPEYIRDLKEEKYIVAISTPQYLNEIREYLKEINPKMQSKLLEDIINEDIPVIGKCSICNKDIRYWTNVGQEVITKYRIIGNGLRKSGCPYCGSVDRYRWLDYILENNTNIYSGTDRTLHFAPELGIEEKIRNRNKNYYTADIKQGKADLVIDMTNMPFENDKFDLIIANHVLEHIGDERKAIAELKRCTRPKGKFILSFPVCLDVLTQENDTLEKKERIFLFGQEDHVRLYGRDFASTLEQHGLRVEVYRPNKILTEQQIENLKLIPDDFILICYKEDEYEK